MLFGVPIVSLVMEGKERLCLAQISSTLLKDFSYNEIHNRRVGNVPSISLLRHRPLGWYFVLCKYVVIKFLKF